MTVLTFSNPSVNNCWNPSVLISNSATKRESVFDIQDLLKGVAQPARDNAWYPRARKRAILDEIESLSNLEENWDLEGAAPISAEAIAAAMQLINVIGGFTQMPDVSPNPNGTISLSWNWGRGHAELEIGRTRHSWVVVDTRSRRRTTTCSGSNSILIGVGASDLVRAISSSRPAESTPPTTVFKMGHVWNDPFVFF